jgi:hypothetical protein
MWKVKNLKRKNNMKRENCENLLVIIDIIEKLEKIKEDLLCEFNEDKITEEHQQYILITLDHINLAGRNLKLLKF